MIADKKIAILAANGFDENQVTEIQRALTKVQAKIKIISPENGLVNGWQGEGWGHHFHVDAPIGEALGSDFDFLILPGGERSVAKLKQGAHTKRIVNHFLDANKPVSAIGDGVALLALGGKLGGHTVAGAESIAPELEQAGAIIGDDQEMIDGHLLTADGSDVSAWVTATVAFFGEADALKRAA